MIIAGIDYSLTSPAICVYDDNLPAEFNSCHVNFLTSTKKFNNSYNGNIVGDLMPVYSTEQQRYDLISEWAINIIKDADVVYIEDYSYGSTGRVFHIAENTGLLKHKLWEERYQFYTVPPTVIKKFATDKGNASKAFLEEKFVEQTSIDLREIMELSPKQSNPVSDIIDSYFICRYGVDLLDKQS